MDSTHEDKELLAIKQIIGALDSLESEEKKRVLDYVFNRMGLKNIRIDTQYDNNLPKVAPSSENDSVNEENIETKSGLIDIRSLKEEKKPKSAIQMAVIVAYYLADVAPVTERKQYINSSDITKYFKQANFELPNAEPIYTLNNAKSAGYLESAGETGTFKLNPVGYNLVVHKMPQNGIVEKRVLNKQIKNKPQKKDLRKNKAK